MVIVGFHLYLHAWLIHKEKEILGPTYTQGCGVLFSAPLIQGFVPDHVRVRNVCIYIYK